jgi:5'-phosphate synthase pdxT subunit
MVMIGILALQGNVREHRENLDHYGVTSRCVRTSEELEGIDGLILPGGESTAMRLLIESSGLSYRVMEFIRRDLPVWATCAGVILLARGGPLEILDVQVERNAYGPQLYSRVERGMTSLSDKEVPMVFIRAPRIKLVSAEIKVLARVNGDVVAARQRNILITTFHPELSVGSPFTAYFLEMVRVYKDQAQNEDNIVCSGNMRQV